jgi:AcrR family transcriptional regulator
MSRKANMRGTQLAPKAEAQASQSTVHRSRDADDTRRRLLDSARARFALDGYSGTTVRDIATDAGVNVALINRYFVSKEGLFEACLRHVAEDLGRSPEDATLESLMETVISQVTGAPSGDQTLQMLLLLRSSGDERAEEIRRSTLEAFARGMAVIAGQDAERELTDDEVLRAQIALATALGVALLRSSTTLEPLSSASKDDLRGPLGGVFSSLLAH